MSGDAPAGRTRRGPTAAFVAALYGALVLTLLGSGGLVVANLDQLVPAGDRGRAEGMALWRDEAAGDRSFAGGVWRQDWFWRSVNLTFATATATMAVAALLGLPAAYALSRSTSPLRGPIEVLFSSIIVLPSSSVGLCLVLLFQYTPLRQLQERLGLQVVYGLPGIVVAQLVLALAMGMSAWKAAFDAVDPRLEQVARCLGSAPWRTFRTVTLPSARSGVVAGLVIAWTRAAAEFGGVLLFCSTFAERPLEYFSNLTIRAGLHQADPLAVCMWSQIEYGNVEAGFAVGFVLVAISAASVLAIHRLGGAVTRA